MPKVILFIATSLDGYIASTDGTVDWLFQDSDYGYTDFMVSVDAVIMGRKTWEQAKTFDEIPFAGKKVFVFTRMSSLLIDGRIRYVHGKIATVVSEIRQGIERNLWLVGGGDLIRQFIDH